MALSTGKVRAIRNPLQADDGGGDREKGATGQRGVDLGVEGSCFRLRGRFQHFVCLLGCRRGALREHPEQPQEADRGTLVL